MAEINDPRREPNLLERFRDNLSEAVILSLAFYLLIAILMIIELLIRNGTDIESSGVKLSYIIIAVIPFLALLLVSGELEEIRGPAGISLLMKNQAATPVSPITESTISVEPDTIMRKGDIEIEEPNPEEVGKLAERIQRIQPTTLSFQIGREQYYAEEAIEAYLGVSLNRNPSFKYVLFTDLNDRFEGIVPVEDFIFIHRTRVDDLVEEIEKGDLLEYQEVVTDFVKQDATNKEALQKMVQTDREKLAVVDDSDQFVGVVHQDQIVRNVFATLFQRSNT